MEQATFKVSLQDEVTKNALKAQASIKSLEAQLRSLNKAVAIARGPEALRRLNIGDQLKTARAQASIAKQSAAAQIAAQTKAMRAQAAETKRIASLKQFKADNGLGSHLGAMMPGGAAGAAAAAAALVAAAVATAVVKVVELGVAFGTAAAQAAVFRQTSIQAMTLLIGNGATAAAQFDSLRHESQALGLNVEDTQKSFQKLLAAQFEIGKARELVRMGADLQAIGASSEEVNRALLAITQIKSKGRLQSQEMLQLQEAGVSAELVYKALGKQLGKTRDELAKMQEAGKIDATTGIEAIMAAVRHKTGAEKTGDAGKAFAQNTLAGMRNQLGAGIQNLFIDAGAKMEPTLTAIGKKVVDLFDSVVNDPAVQNFGNYLLRQFEYFASWLDANWPQVKQEIIGGLHIIIDAIRITGDAISQTLAYWEEWRVVGWAVAAVIGVLAVGSFLLLLPLYLLMGAIAAIVYGLAWLWNWLSANGSDLFGALKWAVSEAVTWMYEGGGNIVRGLIDGIMSMFPAVEATVQKFVSAIKNPFAAAMMMHSPSLLFEQYGMYTVQGYVDGINANDAKIESATSDMAIAAVRGVGVGDDDMSSAGASASSGNTYNLDVTVNASDEAGGQAAGSAIRREMLKLFEELDAA